MSRADGCWVCYVCDARPERCSRAEPEEGWEYMKENPLVSKHPPRSAEEGLRVVGRGCKGGAKNLHRGQRMVNELWQQQGGFRLWQWEKLSEAFQKRVKIGKGLPLWRCVCKTSLYLC